VINSRGQDSAIWLSSNAEAMNVIFSLVR
jgi:hypothetical protein